MRIGAIDQGTTSTRCFVFDDDAAPQLVRSIRHRAYRPRPEWSEHDPCEILANVESCIAAADRVDAWAIANQGESCLAWDAHSGAPLSPIIVWQDRRTADGVEEMRRAARESELKERCGLPLDPYFSASKFAWLLQHDDAVERAWRDRRLRLSTVDAFLLRRLTGVDATDTTTASRTGLMNLHTLRWDATLCEAYGIPMETLVPIRRTVDDYGDIAGVPLRVSIVDQQAALYGNGCRRAGEAKITFGTGAFALSLVDAPAADFAGLSCSVAWHTEHELRYAIEGGVYDAGATLEWARRIGLIENFADVSINIGAPAVERDLIFVPALSGLAAPQWDAYAGALWIGMTNATTRVDLQASLLEGVAFQTADVLARMDACAAHTSTLIADGGLSVNDSFLQFLATLSGRTIERSRTPEATAYGCARLAGLASEIPRGDDMVRAFFPSGSPRVWENWLARYQAAREKSFAWRKPR